MLSPAAYNMREVCCLAATPAAASPLRTLLAGMADVAIRHRCETKRVCENLSKMAGFAFDI
jgi:hypothetical protein